MSEADEFLVDCWIATFGEPPPIKDAELMLPLLAEFVRKQDTGEGA